MSWDPNWSVEAWLEDLGLSVYTEKFIDNGYDLHELCANLKKEDLDAIGVKKEMDRKLIFDQSQALREEAMARFKSKSSVGSAGSTDQSGSMGSHGSFPAYSEPWESLDKEPKHLYTDVWAGEGDLHGVTAAQLHNGHEIADLFDDPKRKLDKQKGNTFPPVPPPKAPRKGKKVWPPGPTSPSQPLPPPPGPAHPLPPAPQSAGKLNKVQLKLKILEELQKDRIILSEAPYCKEDGMLDGDKLAELSHSYAERFQLEPTQVLETVTNIYKSSSTPAEMKKLSFDETDTGAHQPGPRNVVLSSSDLYEEPIDKTNDILALPSHTKEGSPPYKKKSSTLPPPGASDGVYQEPADTLLGVKQSSSPQQKKGPKKEFSGPHLQKPQSHEGSPEEKRRSSPHTSPHSSPRASPSLSPRVSPGPSPLTSPKHTSKKFGFFKRKDKKAARSQSIKEMDLRKGKAGQAVLYPAQDKHGHLEKKKHSSTEDLLHGASSKQSSTATKELHEAKASLTFLPPSVSLPNGGGNVPPPLPPYHRTTSMSSSSTTGSETSPVAPKKFGILRFSKRWGSPQVNPKGNRGHTESELRRKKKRDFRKSRTASDAELHKVGIDSDTEQEHQLLRSSQSHEELRNIRVSHDNTPAPDKAKKETKKGGFFKLLKKKKTVPKKGGGGGGAREGGGEEEEGGGGGGEEDGRSVGSADVEVTDPRLILTSSISMPEIAYAAIRRGADNIRGPTGYEYVTNSAINPEVLVQTEGSKTQPHKSSLRRGRSPIASPISPEMSPLMKRRVTQSGQSHSGDHLIPIQPGYTDEEEGGRGWRQQSPTHTLLKSAQSNESGVFSSTSRADCPSESSETTSIGSQTSKEIVGSVDSRGSVFGSYTSESSMTFPPPAASRTASGSSISKKGPPPPPKPKHLEKGLSRSRVKPPGPSTDVKAERGGKDEGQRRSESTGRLGEGAAPPVKPPRAQRGSVKKVEEVEIKGREGGGGGGGGGSGGGVGTGSGGGGEEKVREEKKPPPKPARRNRTMKPERTDQQVVPETKSQTMPPRTGASENATLAKKDEKVDDNSTSPSSHGGQGSSGSVRETVATRKHGPVPKPRSVRSRPTSPEEKPPPSLGDSISKKLTEEGIDLTVSPYSNVWGEGSVPYALISRYAMELDHPEDSIALIIDEIRGQELKKLVRDYVPIKRVDSMKHKEIAKESLESFLVSIGLPMYLTELRERGYASIPHLLELTESKLQSFRLPSSHRKLLLENIHKL